MRIAVVHVRGDVLRVREHRDCMLSCETSVVCARVLYRHNPRTETRRQTRSPDSRDARAESFEQDV